MWCFFFFSRGNQHSQPWLPAEPQPVLGTHPSDPQGLLVGLQAGTAALRKYTLQGEKADKGTGRQSLSANSWHTPKGGSPLGGAAAGLREGERFQTVISSSSGGQRRPHHRLPRPAWVPAKPHRNAAGHMRCGGGGRASPPAPQGDPAPSCPDAVTKKSPGKTAPPRPR